MNGSVLNEDRLASAPSGSREENSVNILDILITLAKNKRLIICIPVVFAVLAGAISFALPNTYRASTKLLPPQQAQSSAAALLSQLGGVAGMAAGVAGLKNPNELYVGMLKSRSVADRLISQFGLKSAYDVDSLEKARKKLEDNTQIRTGKDGLIIIEVDDRDQKRVAALANGYTAELSQLTKTLAVTEASQRRLFFEQQLQKAKDNLANAEMTLKGAMSASGVISVDAESRAILETLARSKALISAKEIQLNSMRAFLTTSHPDYRRAEEELLSLKSEVAKLENGRDAATAQVGGDTGEQSGFKNIKLLRDLKYYQMLYELLAKQYEAARLDEAKDPSVIQVLDPAVEPERKIKPVRWLIIVLAGAFGLCVAVA